MSQLVNLQSARAAERGEQKPPHPGMVCIPGGTCDKHHPEAAPAQEVTVDGLWMVTRTVTNEEFRRFFEDSSTCHLGFRCIARAADKA